MSTKIQSVIGPVMGVAVVAFVATVMWIGVTANAQELDTGSCPERSSTYRDGILIYQCEIIERSGVYTVVESDSTGVIRERPATQIEVSLYLAVAQERECLARKRVAQDVLSTPITSGGIVDLIVLTERVAAIETAIMECYSD